MRVREERRERREEGGRDERTGGELVRRREFMADRKGVQLSRPELWLVHLVLLSGVGGGREVLTCFGPTISRRSGECFQLVRSGGKLIPL